MTRLITWRLCAPSSARALHRLGGRSSVPGKQRRDEATCSPLGEGDGATPIGTFAIGPKIYGNYANPGGLHDSYHRLVCGDWWDEDPYTSQYNRFVHVPCQTTPSFASSSEALWTIYNIYGYFAVIDFNIDPTLAV